MTKTISTRFAIGLITLGFIVSSAVGLTACQVEFIQCPRSVIKTVGGCDRHGDCGALLEDGSYVQDARQPVVGSFPSGPYCHTVRQ